MIKYFCEQLNNVITFFPDKIMSCCGPELGLIYYNNYKDSSKADFSSLNERKKEYFAFALKDKLIPCHKCFYLREKRETDYISDKFKEINISHWTNCNCNCIYCSRNTNKKTIINNLFKKRGQYYKLLPIIKDLYKYDMLDKENLVIRFQGGDIGVLKEFEDLVKEFHRNGIKEFHFLSNNIIYKPIIAEMFKENKAVLVTSLDCGSRETYKRLKRVDKFDNMINNLKRYKTECGEQAKLNVKYIVVEDYNDNIKEAKQFISIINNLKIPIINYDIDYRKIMISKEKDFIIPQVYYDIYELFETYCKENNCILDINPYTKNILDKGIYTVS